MTLGLSEATVFENVISQSGHGDKKTWWQAESGEGASGPLCVGLGSGVRAQSL